MYLSVPLDDSSSVGVQQNNRSVGGTREGILLGFVQPHAVYRRSVQAAKLMLQTKSHQIQLI